MNRMHDTYLDDLTIHLRLADVPGDDIGAILEEVRDHLAHSGETPEEAFGPAEDYARALVESRGETAGARSDLGPGDLVAGAVQIVAWYLLVYAVVGLATGTDVTIVPGGLAGLALLSAGLAWPVWPAMRAFLVRRVSFVVPAAAMTGLVAGFVALSVLWDEPVIATVPAWPAVVVAIALIAACWPRALRKGGGRIRRPTET